MSPRSRGARTRPLVVASERRRRRRRVLIAAAGLAAIAVTFLFFHLSRNDTPSHVALAACRATRFPLSCISSLATVRSSSPLKLIAAAVSSAQASIPTVTSHPNCRTHLDLAARRLSLAAHTDDLHSSRHFIAASVQYIYDCSNALSYLPKTSEISAASAKVAAALEAASNALSIVTAYALNGSNMSLWSPVKTERDGFWGRPPIFGQYDREDAFPKSIAHEVNITVCKFASCDYERIQDAICSAPEYGKIHFVIYVKAGVYSENVVVPFEKTNIEIVGDGVGVTVIRAALHANMPGFTTYDTATFAAFGDGLRLRDITIENAAGSGSKQAVAFRSDSDRSLVQNVELLGHQDTLYARSLRQLYRNSRISGTVDFIFGNAAAVFENCYLEVVPRLEVPEKGEQNIVTAQGRIDPAQPTGFVFRNCTVNGSAEYWALFQKKPRVHRVYLGRPWKEYSRTVFIDCYLAGMVQPEGWWPWRNEFSLKTLYYGESGSRGPGSNTTLRVEWSNQVPVKHLGIYSVANFIQGNQWIGY